MNSVRVSLASTMGLLLVGLLWVGQGWAQTQTVTAEGMAGIKGDQSIARDNAIQDALRKAVEQAVGTMVASETLVENFQVVRDNILNKSQGYVKEYKIVKESPQKDLYMVTISATVGIGDLKNDLGALGLLMARVGKPRTLFMIAEQNIGQEFLLYWWGWWGKGGAAFAGQTVDMAVSETALKEEFLAKGFNVIDISAVTGKFEISNAYRIADLTDTGAREIGRKMGAELIVKGKALAKEGPRTAGSSVGSYLADITVSAVRVDNGQVLASARGQGVARHVAQHTGGNEAIERAARSVAEKLIDQITAKWTAETSGGQLVQLTISGLASMKDLVKVREFLKSQVRGVQNVIQRSFEGGVAVLEVDAKATAQEIGDELAKKDFGGGLDLDVTGATGNTLEVAVARKGAPVSPPGGATKR
ncbi:MAG: flagellar assembly protein T N-terminal domain-containing protein [Nitrospirae bacterium]|nr:flagellar assembly protein T N-terminal domain-containing protein [Nitrospirota bacterium]